MSCGTVSPPETAILQSARQPVRSRFSTHAASRLSDRVARRDRMSVQFPDTVFKVSADLASGAQTAQSLVQQALARACDPYGQGATTLLTLHRDDALLAARASDQRRRAGQTLSMIDGLPISIKDIFDEAIKPCAARWCCAISRGTSYSASYPAVARCGRRSDRPHKHDGIRLFGRWNQSGLMEHRQSMGPRHRPHSGRIVLGRRGICDRWHGYCRHWFGYRRFGPNSGSVVRTNRFQANSSTYSPGRRVSTVDPSGFHRSAGALGHVLHGDRRHTRRRAISGHADTSADKRVALRGSPHTGSG